LRDTGTVGDVSLEEEGLTCSKRLQNAKVSECQKKFQPAVPHHREQDKPILLTLGIRQTYPDTQDKTILTIGIRKTYPDNQDKKKPILRLWIRQTYHDTQDKTNLS